MSSQFREFVVFPGQGSQSPGMGKKYFENFESYRRVFEEASDATSLHLKKLCFDSSESEIKATSIAQPLILTSSLALFQTLSKEFGFQEKLKAPLYAGHSLGEYSALVAMGLFSVAQAAKTVHLRGQYMQEAAPMGSGGMRALLLKEEQNEVTLNELCSELSALATQEAAQEKKIEMANWNSDTQVVVSGHTQALQLLDAMVSAKEGPLLSLKEKYKWIRKSIVLDVSAPFHSSQMKSAADKLENVFKDLGVQDQKLHQNFYLRNIDASLSDTSEWSIVSAALKKQVAGNVKWYPSLLKAKELGIEVQYEIGFGKILSNISSRCEKLSQWKCVHFEGIEDLNTIQNLWVT